MLATVVSFEVLILLMGRIVSERCLVHNAAIFTAFQNEDIDGEIYNS